MRNWKLGYVRLKLYKTSENWYKYYEIYINCDRLESHVELYISSCKKKYQDPGDVTLFVTLFIYLFIYLFIFFSCSLLILLFIDDSEGSECKISNYGTISG